MKISDVFIVKTGKRITEEEVYNNKGEFPCITAQTSNDGITWLADRGWIESNYRDFIIDENECITWSKDGAKCGTLFYRDYSFYPNDHCGVLIPKEEYKEEINLRWFIYRYQQYIKEFVTQQGSQGMLYNNEMSEIEIEYPFPSKEEQNKLVQEYVKLIEIRKKIENELSKIDRLLQRKISGLRCRRYTVEKIALLSKGSNKISEEMIYNNYDKNGISVFSSATENKGLMGKVKETCYNSFNKQGHSSELTWTTNGYAGIVFFREEDYLYSEKCGRIVIRKEFKNKILPKFLMYILNQITYMYRTSESNNGKLDIIHMANIPIEIPIDKNGNIDIEKQEDIIIQYDKVEKMKNKLKEIIVRIDKIIG